MVCERHDDIIEQLGNHDERIRVLEIADGETKTEIKNLIKQMEKLVETMEKFISSAWKVTLGASGIGISFIIWYIQKG